MIVVASLTQSGGVIHADAIKQAIESNEDIFLDKKVEIQGDLDLTPQLDISPRENPFNAVKLVNSKIFISNCIFRGSLKLTNCRFCEDVCFSGSHFD